jgi:murein DD-endopeptidase MepM/ murein hydrolase activator NlpD
MDTALEEQLNEQLRVMSELLAQQADMLGAQNKNLSSLNSSLKTQSTNVDNTVKSEKAANDLITGNNKKTEAAAAANEMIADANRKLSASFYEGKKALLGFAGAMIDTTPGMAKYATSVKGATEAAGGLAEVFGPLGKVASVLLGAISSLVTAAFKYNDAVVKGYDDVAKLGGAIGSSAEGILELAHKAGLSSQNLEIFTKNAARLGPGLKALGTTTSEGVTKFGQFIAVGDRTLIQYRRLGYTQEDLIESQTRYMEIQSKTGVDMTKSPQQLQKASLQYLDSLNVLANITGVSAKQQQDNLEAAYANENYNAYIASLKAKAAATTDENEKLRLENIIKSKDGLAALAAQMSPENAKGLLELLSTTGEAVVTESSAPLVRNIPGLLDIVSKTSQGMDQRLEFIAASNKGLDNYNQNYKEAATGLGQYSRDFMAQNAIDAGRIKLRAATADADEATLRKIADDARDAYEQKKNQEGGATDQRGKQEAAERAARLQFDTVLKTVSDYLVQLALKIMPRINQAAEYLVTNLDTIGKVLKGLAIALAGLAGIAAVGKVIQTVASVGSVIKSVLGMGKGKLGTADNPAIAEIEGMGTSSPNKRGIFSRFFGSESGPAAIPEADMLDKNGKPLSGAARASRARKLGGAVPSGLGKGVSGLSKAGSATGGGSLVAGFLEGVGKGLAFIGKPPTPAYVALGAGAIGIAIAAIGAGLAGATWILGKSMPSLAEGLKSFDGVNGENLKSAGIGMAGLGAGILAMGAGGILDALGNIGEWFTFGEDKDPIKTLGLNLVKFQAYDINKQKVENNAGAFVAFAKAMAVAGPMQGVGSIAIAISDSVSNFFSKEPPFKKFVDFSELPIDPKRAKENATAFKLFAEALSSYRGEGQLGVLGSVASALSNAVVKLFGERPPLDKFLYFSLLPIDPIKTKNNAIAFKDFANALAEYKGGPGAWDAFSSFAGNIVSFMTKQDGPIDAFDKFTRMTFGPNMEKNTAAFAQYAQTVGALAGNVAAASAPPGSGPASTDGGSGNAGSGPNASVPAGPPPTMQSGRTAIIDYANKLGSEDKARFYETLAKEARDKARASAAAGNTADSKSYADAAGQYAAASSSAAQNAIAEEKAGYIHPVAGGVLTSPYGMRIHPKFGTRKFHTGLDIGKGMGAPLRAAKGGIVTKLTNNGRPYTGFGNAIIIQQDDGYQSVYTHTSKYGVNEGDRVSQGQYIGDMGSTGISTGPHLHYIIQKAGLAVPNSSNTIDPATKISKARDGGIFGEGEGDFDSKIGSLNPQSIIAKLGKKPADNISEINTTSKMTAKTAETENVYMRNMQLTEQLGQKLDELIDVMNDTHDTNHKILQHSRT